MVPDGVPDGGRTGGQTGGPTRAKRDVSGGARRGQTEWSTGPDGVPDGARRGARWGQMGAMSSATSFLNAMSIV
jgi:hypothetical protein